MIKKGFTLVELLIVVAIIAVLSGAAYIGIQRSQARGMNERMVDDLNAIVSALEQYKQDEGNYPEIADGPLILGQDKNVNCFNDDTTYAHDCATAEFIQTQVDNTLLTKRYLQEVPTDPRTESRYVYGVTTDGQFFQVAGNWLNDDGTYTAKVVGNLNKGYAMPSLIRAFDGPNFVMDGEGYLPYSPDHLSITARLDEISGGTVTVDGTPVAANTVVKAGSKVKTGPGTTAVLYFSDGSITYLDPNTELWVLPNAKVEQNDKDGIITKIRIKIFSGKIWSKVARLASKSEFNVETTGAIAGVRGTEFGIDAETGEIIILSGEVAARRIKSTDVIVSAGTGNSYVEFDSNAVSTFGTNQIAMGANDGTTFTKFTLAPDPGQPINNVGTLSSSEGDALKLDYYKGAFNNNIRPRILKIDTTVAPPTVTFKLQEGVKKVLAIDSTNTQVGTWTGPELNLNPTDISIIAKSTLFGKVVRFQFLDSSYPNPRATGFTPPVPVDMQVVLSENDIYNMMLAEDNGQPPNPPVQISSSSNVTLGNDFNYTANIPCKWSIVAGSGALVPTSGIHSTYKSVDPGLSLSALMADVAGRFDNTQTNLTRVRCTDPLDPNNYDEVNFYVNYDSYEKSLLPPNGSGYRYSYYAGKMNWDGANNACNSLKEGALNWALPSKGDAALGIDIADADAGNGKTSLDEINLTCQTSGNICADTTVFGSNTGAVWLKDQNGPSQAYAAIILNLLLSPFNKTTPLAFRCIAL